MSRRSLVALALALVGLLGVGATPAAAQTTDGTVRFSATSVQVDESSEMVRLYVERTGALHLNRLLVDYATESGTARGGVDYFDTSGTLAFDVGESIKTVFVRIRNDAEAEEREQFAIRLFNPRGETASTGTPATITIVDDDGRSDDPNEGPVTAVDASQTRRAASARPAAGSTPSPPVPAPAKAAAVAPAEVAVARPPSRPAVRTRRPVASTSRRSVALRQSPVIPFELRPATSGTTVASSAPARVDPLLALLAGLLLARVAAEVWFRSRLAAVAAAEEYARHRHQTLGP